MNRREGGRERERESACACGCVRVSRSSHSSTAGRCRSQQPSPVLRKSNILGVSGHHHRAVAMLRITKHGPGVSLSIVRFCHLMSIGRVWRSSSFHQMRSAVPPQLCQCLSRNIAKVPPRFVLEPLARPYPAIVGAWPVLGGHRYSDDRHPFCERLT